MTTSDNDELWKAYVQSVKPIKKRSKATARPVKAKSPVPSMRKTSAALTSAVRFHKPPPTSLEQLPLDRHIERRLRQGEVQIEARIDLHGMRQDQAHVALDHFLARQIRAGYRALLIITGKGRDGEGVLRANLSGWLAASPHAARILTLRKAAIKHGGDGAFYLLLKRQK